MNAFPTNKRKLFNDPVHGFIRIADDFLFDLIEHPYFQRLRRITQLGLSNTVYPGANHTRFHHALGAMHLMDRGISILRQKGVEITDDERMGALCAILLHDIGHGPFSHALERSVIPTSHEAVSLRIIEALNEAFSGRLEVAISLFKGTYKKKFLCEMISSQLDMDRMDYLRRDSFYTGVSEGAVNTSRLLEMLHVANDHLVVEYKGVYSIEKFLVARKLMYWQVYLHKAVLVAETLIVHVLQRAKEVGEDAAQLATPVLAYFLREKRTLESPEFLNMFTKLDDHDVWAAIKNWAYFSQDYTLRNLSLRLLNRRLMRIELHDAPVLEQELELMRSRVMELLDLKRDEASFFVYTGQVSNAIYRTDNAPIYLIQKDGVVVDYAQTPEYRNSIPISANSDKYFLIYPKDLL